LAVKAIPALGQLRASTSHSAMKAKTKPMIDSVRALVIL